MFDWLFRNNKTPQDLDQVKTEKWETSFGNFQEKRFHQEEGPGYRTELRERSVCMEIVKPRLFAWNVNPWFQYRDCVIDATFSFGVGNGASAIGLVFRYTNDENYYFCLVSKQGLFRFDVVFNGKPIVLIPWLNLPKSVPDQFNLQVISHGQHFSFYIDKEWVAEIADDHLSSGRNGWAAQNYGDRPRAEFFLYRFGVESRPLEVEALYYRWTRLITAEPSQRKVLAQTLFGAGKFIEAQIQMRRAIADSLATLEDQFFLAQCAMRLERLDEAMSHIQEILLKNPTWELALREKANLLYLQNRYLELRDYLVPLMERLPGDELLWNLKGHAETGLGNYAKALDAYSQAALFNPNGPIFQINVGRTLEKLKKPSDAATAYLLAGSEFFRQGAWDEVEDLLRRLEFLGEHSSPEAQALKGKLLYQQGDRHRARLLLENALEEGTHDSAVYYLYSLIQRDDGDKRGAIRSLKKAVALEGDFALYHFRLAEILHSLGEDFEPHLQKALQFAPSDPWILNFRGVTSTENTEKTFYLEKAYLVKPEELSICLNLSDQYHALGRREEAFTLLAPFEGLAEAHNHRGNLFSREGRFLEALNEYEIAIEKAPLNVDYKENAAACALELQMVTRAEEILLEILELQPSPKVYTALGNLMRTVGDFVRSEVSLRSGLEMDPGYLPALVELGYLYLSRQKFALVQGLIKQLEKSKDHPSVQELIASHRRLAMERLFCSDCGREWWVPRPVPAQAALRIHGDIPNEAPAGISPVTGKIYCVGCAQKHMKDGRFLCPESGEPLQLKDDRLKFLLRTALEASS